MVGVPCPESKDVTVFVRLALNAVIKMNTSQRTAIARMQQRAAVADNHTVDTYAVKGIA